MDQNRLTQALDDLSAGDTAFDPDRIREIGEAGLQFFKAHLRTFLAAAEKRDAPEGDDYDFIAALGGIVLHQTDNQTAILVKVAPEWQSPLYWTPRNALFVTIAGRVEYDLFEIDGVADNAVFRPGLPLIHAASGAVDPLQGFVKHRDQVNRQRAAGSGPALVVALFSKPLGQLDWVFDDRMRSHKAMFADPDDSVCCGIVDTLASLKEDDPTVRPPDAALLQLARHEMYMIRWSALKLLWDTGRMDAFVAAAVRDDPHPEIARHRDFFLQPTG